MRIKNYAIMRIKPIMLIDDFFIIKGKKKYNIVGSSA